MFAVRNGRTSLRIDSGRSTVILNSGIVILYCLRERSEESGAEPRRARIVVVLQILR